MRRLPHGGCQNHRIVTASSRTAWRDVLRVRGPFGRLGVVQAMHSAGDALFAVSLAGSLFFAVSLDAARPRIGLYLLLTMAPFAFVAPLLGPLSDRLRGGHRAVLVVSCLARASICWLLVEDLRNLLLYPEAFAVLVLGKTYSVSKNAVIPSLVEYREQLVQMNSRLTLVSLAGSAVGGAIGSGLVAQWGAPWALRLATVVFVLAGVAAFAVPRVRAGEAASAVVEYEAIHTPVVQLGAWSMALLRGSVGFLLFLVGFELRRAGEPAWLYGIVFAASGLGALVGSVTAPRLRRRIDEERMLVGALALPGMFAVVGAVWFGRPAILAVPLALGIAAAVGRQSFDALVQHHAPAAGRGRAFARFESLFQLAWVIGALVPVVTGAGARAGFAMLGVVLAAGTVAHALQRRSALQIDAGLRALRGRLLDDAADPAAVDRPLAERLLANADRHTDTDPRLATIEAASALDVALAQVDRDIGDVTGKPLEPRQLERARRAVDNARRGATTGAPVPADVARRTIAMVREVVDAVGAGR